MIFFWYRDRLDRLVRLNQAAHIIFISIHSNLLDYIKFSLKQNLKGFTSQNKDYKPSIQTSHG